VLQRVTLLSGDLMDDSIDSDGLRQVLPGMDVNGAKPQARAAGELSCCSDT
jgi:hypothetical protein